MCGDDGNFVDLLLEAAEDDPALRNRLEGTGTGTLYVAKLRAAHRCKRNFMAALDTCGLS